ncbi:MAG TPA: PilW family protein [Rhodocyclaceae bacterium]|nr:PilW family protein [Rhodocyclaceae bacterium]
MKPLSPFRKNHSGFGLVEVMVAAMIGMFTVMAIMQALAGAESHRRQMASGSSADSAGAIALQILQRAIYSAGAGMTGDANNIFTVCNAQQVNASNTAAGAPGAIVFPTLSFAPIRIWNVAAPPTHLNAAGFDANTDIIQVIGGGSDYFFGRGVPVGNWVDPTNFAHIVVNPRDPAWDAIPGLHSGDLVIVVQAGQNCQISQITGLSNQGQNVLGEATCDAPTPNTAATGAQIRHIVGTFRNFYNGCQQEVSNWNGGGAFGGTAGTLYPLGSPDRFSIRAYAIRSGQLTACAPLYQDCTIAASWQVLGDNIVSLKAQYGYDTNGNQVLDAGEWNRTAPTVNWDRLKAFRLALVARNKQMERDVVASADCAPVWSGFATADTTCSGSVSGAQIFLLNGHDGANWNRYRYKLYETTVPLRNLYWSN